MSQLILRTFGLANLQVGYARAVVDAFGRVFAMVGGGIRVDAQSV
jgi:hypothetical protein